ncbi:hypothetical protein DKX38_006833 [Salix brachista]|uniref:X8 domain-containing protein n=1 Tax=Salix brachista TaxID=2182728 RepID=A0A5N5MLI2_9ROSI|nr:hypothetical protein DKX38_006833 [Salix brachista]
MMAKVASRGLFLFFLSLLTVSSSGTFVGFSYNARGITAASSLGRIVTFLELNKVSASHIRVFAADHRVLTTLSNFNVSVDLYLDDSFVENLTQSKPSAISWLKAQIVTFLPHVNIRSIIVNGNNCLSKLLSTLKSIHSALSSFHVDNEVKVSVAFSLTFLERLNRTQEKDFRGILGFIKRTTSFVIIETSIDMDVELGMKDLFIQSMIQKVAVATSLFSPNDAPIVMIIKSLVIPSAKEVAEFGDRVSKSLGNAKIRGQVAGLYAEVSSVEDFAGKNLKSEHEQIFPSSRREILRNFKTTLHDDIINPPTVFPTNPGSTPAVVTLLPDTPTPTIITVPATNPADPVAVTPTNPVSTPLPFPNTTPVNVTPTNPSVNPPPPTTNPVTTPAPITVPGAQPVTNPVTTYPAPAGNTPITAPVTNPAAPPATTNAPAIPGQSWCVARSGVMETALQPALDYACGMGGADCSQIQQGGNCYSPNSLQNHASYAFNTYYQKNPVASSCDFGGTATIVNVNPSTGSCVYPSSSSPTPSLPVPTTSPANPVTTSPANPVTTSPPNPATTSPANPVTTSPPNPVTTSPANSATSPPGTGVPGTPPSLLNSSTNPASGFGFNTPPVFNPPASKSTTLKPFIGRAILVASFVARTIILDK